MTPLETATARFVRAEEELRLAGLELERVVAAAIRSATRVRMSNPLLANIQTIQRIVAEYHNVTIGGLICRSRRISLVAPRHQAMALCREILGIGQQNLSEVFGCKDHGTVAWAEKSVQARRDSDANYAAEFMRLKDLCRTALAQKETAA